MLTLSASTLRDQDALSKVLEGRAYGLQHPWFGIVNRSQADINKNVDMNSSRQKEREYFESSPEYGHLAHKMRSEYLAKLLSQSWTVLAGPLQLMVGHNCTKFWKCAVHLMAYLRNIWMAAPMDLGHEDVDMSIKLCRVIPNLTFFETHNWLLSYFLFLIISSYMPTPVLVIIDVQPKELGIPTKAYYAVEEVKEDVFNLLPNLNVSELIKAFAVKTNDMMLVIYLSSLIRSVLALHNLINTNERGSALFFNPFLEQRLLRSTKLH
ncbi:uncharacterized protein [Henckelia pumila]|uniref:uncharacterized protein isoform X2 n=1 Tax=Henckelia pumila TaxID=405737 RepID=UPI003C6E4D72